MRLFGEVVALLARAGVAHALIGAAAMAAHGISRATADVDLLTVDPAVLTAGSWTPLADAGASVRVARGDPDDPLAGTVRLTRANDRTVDVVVGRYAWQREVIERAPEREVAGHAVRVVALEGLVLLKLYAGGPRDAWDVQLLLEVISETSAVIEGVERTLPRLPAESRELWDRIRSGAKGRA